MRSLSARLLVSVSVLLLIALSLTAIILDSIFRNTAINSTSERLNTHLLLLMSSADIDPDSQFSMPELLPEARFMTPGSDLLGFVYRIDELLWKSDSAIGIDGPEELPASTLDTQALSEVAYDATEYFQSSMSIEWEVADNSFETYQFIVAESKAPFIAQLNAFRTRLFSWFAFLIVCIVLAQAALMRKILSPLRKIAQEVKEIDHGERERLSDNYPSELLGVTSNTNALIQAERSRLERYRNTLGNLAHSLKTPLAVIHTATEKQSVDKAQIRSQVSKMNDIVGYQLKKAATVGQTTLGHAPINISALTSEICNALAKVYYDKGLRIEQHIPQDLDFYADPGDLSELLGNLLDNACKWSKQHVRISAGKIPANTKRNGLSLLIEDDGNGIPESVKDDIVKRGHRADETTPGHGIGLSVVKEIIQSYSGTLEIKQSDIGGATFYIKLNA
ncbi:MAG: GHKL domain-containing protein [Gammaproteobacteria bacterium]|nr:GHKL domain-containing protein [Gammaproteobacteria bacterium]NNC96842.1 GHKL domain-containing protein [Gammaproteobacteria bacterium]NNM14558.1 GHKL domain-containing protein [Gammaproteobacteria bacterium]